MQKKTKKICIINAVGLTYDHCIKDAFFKQIGEVQPVEGVFPALTCSVQASLLTGKYPNEHGIVGNGWLFPDTREVRFWQQSHHLIESDSFLVNRKVANLFWWFALGSPCQYYVTPRPFYANNSDKVFGILDKTSCQLEEKLGKFPFHEFWGPFAGGKSSEWIAKATAEVIRNKETEITLCYLPHLDYDFQRFGPNNEKPLEHLKHCLKVVLEACQQNGVEPVIVSEYGIVPTQKAVFLNRFYREKGWLKVRPGPFGETVDFYESKVFAVVDHQMAHVYLNGVSEAEVKRETLKLEGVADLVPARELFLEHERSGKLIALSEDHAWFAWPYWLEKHGQPDFAECVDIHRKPGYDPCELNLKSKTHLMKKLLLKKCGFKARMDMIDPNVDRIRGSHGLVNKGKDRSVIIGKGELPTRQIDFRAYIERSLNDR